VNHANLHHANRFIRAPRAFLLVIAVAAILGIGQARAELVTFEFAGVSKSPNPDLARNIYGYYTFESTTNPWISPNGEDLFFLSSIKAFEFVSGRYRGRLGNKEEYHRQYQDPSKVIVLQGYNDASVVTNESYVVGIDFLGNNPSIDGYDPPPHFLLRLNAQPGSTPLGNKLPLIPPDIGKFRAEISVTFRTKVGGWASPNLYELTSLTILKPGARPRVPDPLVSEFRPYAPHLPSPNAPAQTRQKSGPVQRATGLVTFDFRGDSCNSRSAPLGSTISGYYAFDSTTRGFTESQGARPGVAAYFNAIKSMQFASGVYRGRLSSELQQDPSLPRDIQKNIDINIKNNISVSESNGWPAYEVEMTFVGNPLPGEKNGRMRLGIELRYYLGSGPQIRLELPLLPPDLTLFKRRKISVSWPWSSETPEKFNDVSCDLTALTLRPPGSAAALPDTQASEFRPPPVQAPKPTQPSRDAQPVVPRRNAPIVAPGR